MSNCIEVLKAANQLEIYIWVTLRFRCFVMSIRITMYNQRTSGPVNAHLISWPSKAQMKKKDNKQCLLDTRGRVTVNNKRLISNHKKSEKKYAYTKAMALLRITKGNNSNSIGP